MVLVRSYKMLYINKVR